MSHAADRRTVPRASEEDFMAAKQLMMGCGSVVAGDDCSMGYEPKNACLIRKRALITG